MRFICLEWEEIVQNLMVGSLTFTIAGVLNRKDQQPPLASQGDIHSTEGAGERFGNQILNPIWVHQMLLLTTRRAGDSGGLLPIKHAPATSEVSSGALQLGLLVLSVLVLCCQTLSLTATYCNELSPPLAEQKTENQVLT